MQINRFEDIECWQLARMLVKFIYALTTKAAFRKDFDLVSQIRRSAVSVMANIAEGFHRHSTKDFLKFLDYARASVAEIISHAYVGLDQRYITETEMSDLKTQADALWKKINAFITYLNSLR